MKHHEINITPVQRANLLRLAEYLEGERANLEFDMEHYCTTEDGSVIWPSRHECGSVACAVGHGPSAGIEPLYGEYWDSYSERVFCGEDGVLFFWMFDTNWAFSDNDPRGAAARIRYTLKRGIPQNYKEQLLGQAPLSYTVEGS